jgi:hypothetical protein
MSNLGNAYALATALYARDKSKPLEDMAEQLYHCVEVLEFGEDERKADLYAQLAESLADGMTFEHVVSAIEAAMDSTDRRFPHG